MRSCINAKDCMYLHTLLNNCSIAIGFSQDVFLLWSNVFMPLKICDQLWIYRIMAWPTVKINKYIKNKSQNVNQGLGRALRFSLPMCKALFPLLPAALALWTQTEKGHWRAPSSEFLGFPCSCLHYTLWILRAFLFMETKKCCLPQNCVFFFAQGIVTVYLFACGFVLSMRSITLQMRTEKRVKLQS